jgi:hypothetical protein
LPATKRIPLLLVPSTFTQAKAITIKHTRRRDTYPTLASKQGVGSCFIESLVSELRLIPFGYSFIIFGLQRKPDEENPNQSTMSNHSPLRTVAKPQDPIGLERDLQDVVDSVDGWKGFDVYISPCLVEASNDPFTPEDIDAMKICDQDFYGSCVDDIADFNTTGLFKLGITFDYELHYQIGANFTKTLAALEASMLEHLASVVGLNDCQQGRNLRNRQLRFRQLQLLSESELSRFEGVSSLPLDTKDPYWGKHIVVMSQLCFGFRIW